MIKKCRVMPIHKFRFAAQTGCGGRGTPEYSIMDYLTPMKTISYERLTLNT